jgi:SAM-dependent methyltransferase
MRPQSLAGSEMRRDPDSEMTRRDSLERPYGDAFYRSQRDGSYRSALVVLGSLFELYRPTSVLDLGCGVGAWLRAAGELGIDDVIGVDGQYAQEAGLLVPEEQFVAHDFREPLRLGRSFELAISVEVAEHLPAAAAATFVESLTDHAPVVLFSAAIPGQAGTGHVNEQWPDYWTARFAERGFYAFDCLRAALWTDSNVEYWYRQNLLVFSSDRNLLSGIEPSVPLSLVHPEQFADALGRGRSKGLHEQVAQLPGPVRAPVAFAAKHLLRARRAWRTRAHG